MFQEIPEGVVYFHSLKTFTLGYNVYLPVDHSVPERKKKQKKNFSPKQRSPILEEEIRAQQIGIMQNVLNNLRTTVILAITH